MTREEANITVTNIISRYSKPVKDFDLSTQELSILINKIYDDIDKKIQFLESICDELVQLPKGQESHSWSDYKIGETL